MEQQHVPTAPRPTSALTAKLARAVSEIGHQLGSTTTATLIQTWVPEAGEDGALVLNTQGLPFCVNGAGDLLALFRCVSCRYKFPTSASRAAAMGPVGRVFASGEPELAAAVSAYDDGAYCRVAEAARCEVRTCIFMPVFATPARDRPAAVLELVQTAENAGLAGLAGWARGCLEAAGLFTSPAEGDAAAAGLLGRGRAAAAAASAFESAAAAAARPWAPPRGAAPAPLLPLQPASAGAAAEPESKRPRSEGAPAPGAAPSAAEAGAPAAAAGAPPPRGVSDSYRSGGLASVDILAAADFEATISVGYGGGGGDGAPP